jgi:Protein of unknown function (DUF3631)
VILPDNDETGRQHAGKVAMSLVGIAKRVRIVTLPGLPEKGDASAWIDAGGTAEQLWALIEQAPDWQPKAAPRQAKQPPTADDDPAHWFVEPWPEAVSGADLLHDLTALVKRYMVLPKYGAETLALWVLHAWTIDASEISPFLTIVSPTKQCGKTTLLTLVYWLTPRSVLASGISSAALFRYIEECHPTLLIDEADACAKDNEALRGVLNSGHTKPAARVIRCESDGHHIRTRAFSTWCPKVVATIGALADTLMDRSIILVMRRKAKGEKVERLRLRDTDELGRLRQRMLRWAEDSTKALETADPNVPAQLDNRPADNWRPLLAIADRAGGDWPKLAREVAKAVSGASTDDNLSIGVELLRDIQRVFADGRNPEWLGAEELVRRLIDLEETIWKEFQNGREISSRRVAFMLKGFGIRSVKERGPRKYFRKDFAEAWGSYVPPVPPEGAD